MSAIAKEDHLTVSGMLVSLSIDRQALREVAALFKDGPELGSSAGGCAMGKVED
jgi:hypothetical protein